MEKQLKYILNFNKKKYFILFSIFTIFIPYFTISFFFLLEINICYYIKTNISVLLCSQYLLFLYLIYF